MQRMWKQSPQTGNIRHTLTHKKPRYQKLHGAIAGGAPPPPPLDPPLNNNNNKRTTNHRNIGHLRQASTN